MELLIIIAIGAALAGGAFYAVKRAKGQQKALPAVAATRTLLTLRVNDIVSHFTTDYLVEGKLTYNDDGDEWYTFMLVDGDKTVWLSVEEDDRLEAALYHEVEDLSFTQKPPEYVDYDGHTYELEEWGRARVTRVGTTGTKMGMSVTYYDYEGPGGRLLSVEQWGQGEFEVSVGQPIRPNELEILPGDDVGEGLS